MDHAVHRCSARSTAQGADPLSRGLPPSDASERARRAGRDEPGGFKTLDVAEGWREQLERAEAMGTIEMLAVIEDRVGGDQETLAALIERWFVEDLLGLGGWRWRRRRATG